MKSSKKGNRTRSVAMAGNEVTSLAEPGGSCSGTMSKCTTFAYSGNGARTTVTYPGSTVQTATLDKSGRPTEIRAVHGTTVLSDLTYGYLNAATPAWLPTR